MTLTSSPLFKAPSVHVRDAVVQFGPKQALKITDFRVTAGAKVLVTGPSGLGKTTLLHLLAGLLLPSSGYVEVGGRDLCKMSDEQRCALRRADCGVIFQTLNLIGHLTAAENILLGLTLPRPAATAATAAALKQVHLEDYAETPSAALSTGQQQRVAVARVLAAKPRLILADEPTSSLDAANSDLILNALFSTVPTATLVMVSHDLRLCSRFSQVRPISEVLG